MPSDRSLLGSRGEQIAAKFLTDKGYLLLEANYRCRWGEVDLVARDGKCTVFVEVRTRRTATFGGPEESITKRKAQRLVTTAQTYLSEHGSKYVNWRIDLVSIKLDQRGKLQPVEHLMSAVDENLLV